MISTPLPPARTPRAPQAKAATPAAADDAETRAQQQALASQRQAFDMQMEETAELEREGQALEQLMLAQLKDSDEIVKKFIELI